MHGFLVVIFLKTCSGSVISKHFVITAAHCLGRKTKYVRCGDMALSWNKSKCKSRILKQIPHPSSLIKQRPFGLVAQNDIALLYIEELNLKKYGRLHSADFKTFAGRAVKYAGYGATSVNITSKEMIEDLFRPLQIGEGVIFNDNDKSKTLGRPQLLVAPKCTKKNQHVFIGDSGGPLFVDGQIVGVACAVSLTVLQKSHNHPAYFGFTPISPYLDWIREVTANFESNSFGGQIHFKRKKKILHIDNQHVHLKPV